MNETDFNDINSAPADGVIAPTVDSTIDGMLALTAEIADGLLHLKDEGLSAVPDDLKLKIISLVEMASRTDNAPAEQPDDSPLLYEEEMEAEAILEQEQEPEPEPMPEREPEQELESKPEPEHEPTPEREPTPEPEPEPEPEPQPGVIRDDAAEAEATLEQAEEMASEEPAVAFDSLRRAFSINDAFLFRREIFGGSRDAYLNALHDISLLTTRRQLTDYLEQRLGLNLEESPGKEFFAILSVYFPD